MLLPLPPHTLFHTDGRDQFPFQELNGNKLLAVADLCGHHGRMSVVIGVEMRALSQDERRQGSHRLGFCFELRFRVFLCFPAIFEPIGALPYHIAEAQAYFLSFLFLPHTPEWLTYPGETSVPFFFSCLRPAPDIPHVVPMHLLQPPALRVSLYPFQRRTVFWLLQREGMTIDEDGRVIPSPVTCGVDTPVFWRLVQNPSQEPGARQGGFWWYNRLSGDLRGEAACVPLEEDFNGAVLAESMGLGKTCADFPST